MPHPVNSNHRHCYLFTGNTTQIHAAFAHHCNEHASALICTHDVNGYLALNAYSNTDIRSFKQIKNTLGQTYDAVLIDLTHGISASVLAILAGTVRGNGVFALGLPEQDWQQQADQEMARYLPWPYEPQEVTSHFKTYFLSQLINEQRPFQRISADNINDLELATSHVVHDTPTTLTLTDEQALAQSALMTSLNTTHVLIAPRGRGKSTLLGDTLAKWVKEGKKVAVTAATPEALVSLQSQFDQAFLFEDDSPPLPFYAPDALLLMPEEWEHLIIDEAARLPIPVLTALLNKATQCVFSTTDYGYEGAGKGFGIRFCRSLALQTLGNQANTLKRLTLTQPIRWGENDPLEKWINNLLFLCPPFDEKHTIQTAKHLSSFITTRQGAQWLDHLPLLESAFHLLVNAHYQTSPDNLRWVLDDPSVTTWLSLSESEARPTPPTIQSVAILTQEGELPSELSQAVLEGSRRPRGHLVPQSLMAHEGILEAGQYRYWRISRIATQPDLQGQGLASELINEISTAAFSQADFICTSFAASLDVVAFWQKNGFIAVRLGTTKDQASGSYSLMMVKPLNSVAEQQSKQWHALFIERFQMNVLLCYQDLSAALIIQLLQTTSSKASLPSPTSSPLNEQDQSDLKLFCYHHRPFDSVRSQLYLALFQLSQQGKLDPLSPLDALLFDTVLGRDTKAQQKIAKLSGRKQLYLALKNKLKIELFSATENE